MSNSLQVECCKCVSMRLCCFKIGRQLLQIWLANKNNSRMLNFPNTLGNPSVGKTNLCILMSFTNAATTAQRTKKRSKVQRSQRIGLLCGSWAMFLYVHSPDNQVYTYPNVHLVCHPNATSNSETIIFFLYYIDKRNNRQKDNEGL